VEIKLAKSYGFCFGVKRAIKIAEELKDATTIGPLIHNNEEINRLKKDFNVGTSKDFKEFYKNPTKKAIIRTHGIEKQDLEVLKSMDVEIVNATCPYVTNPQNIVKKMSEEGYQIVIFGDEKHPEVKGVKSYSESEAIVVSNVEEIKEKNIKRKVAIVSQTTKKVSEFQKVINYLVERTKEVRVFNTICNATFENQDAVRELSKEADVMIIIGGKNSSNTKELFNISKLTCKDSYHIENEDELKKEWFIGKELCGISAGASTPDWIIEKIVQKIKVLTK
jgi:4-hydroxy-3-methylbut-2-enyl diphosphate reductase